MAADWQSGAIDASLRELHARKSLDATSADVAVVVTMAAALFAGTFDAACNLGAMGSEAAHGLDRERLQVGGLAGLMLFTLSSLLLSSRIVVRLRIALAEHAGRLAALRGGAWGGAAAGAVFGGHVVWYPLVLALRRRRPR